VADDDADADARTPPRPEPPIAPPPPETTEPPETPEPPTDRPGENCPDATDPSSYAGPVRMGIGVALTGVVAGVGGVLLTLLLHLVQHLAFGYTENTFLVGVRQASDLRRVLAMSVGGAIVGIGWWLQRRHIPADVTVGHALANPERDVPVPQTIVDCALQIIAVGFGASLGREGAPRQLGAAGGAFIAGRLGMSRAQRRTVVACGAGAGLAAVYNVPLGGAVFTMEILLVSVRMRELGPALAASGIATVVAWPVLSDHATYEIPTSTLTPALLAWAVISAPIAGAVGVAFVRLMFVASAHLPNGWRLPATVFVVFTALGALAIPYPELLGNGRGAAALAFDAAVTLPLAFALALLKPLATAACLRAGAKGGLLTPALATGALFGVATGRLWSDVFGHLDVGACALIGAAAVLATTQRAPLTAIVLVVEFTHSGEGLLAPIVLAVAGASYTASVIEHVLDRRPDAVGIRRAAADDWVL
jgi:H+/Cl- antiporter ClcA